MMDVKFFNRIILEAELFSGSNTYPAGVMLDTGMTGLGD